MIKFRMSRDCLYVGMDEMSKKLSKYILKSLDVLVKVF